MRTMTSCPSPCRWRRILEMVEIKTVPYVPLSHPFVERLIGTVRRELLDRTLFWTVLMTPPPAISVTPAPRGAPLSSCRMR